MNRSPSLVLVSALVLLLLAPAAGSAPTAPLAGAPSLVSYQGQVFLDGAPYSGTGYFKFAIVNADGSKSYWTNDGTSPADPFEPAAYVQLTVTNGLFSVLLGDTSLIGMTEQLSAEVFGDPETSLRVWFSSGGSTFTQLADRRIAAVPYALVAEKAASAEYAANADMVDGYHASAFQRHYANVIVVAKSGGDFTTIQAALDSITDAADTRRYLVWVAPGVYYERVTMKPYVDIEGAGELATVITCVGSADYIATLAGADNAELRHLKVENTGGATYAIAIYNYGVSPRLVHVTASAHAYDSSSSTWAVYNYSANPLMVSVSATASGGGNNAAVWNEFSSPWMQDVIARATGGDSSNNYGVYNATSSPTMKGVEAAASGGVGSSNYGLGNSSSSPVITDVQARASGGASSYNYGVHNYSSQLQMSGVTASASGGGNCHGVYNWQAWVTIDNSTITATGGTTNVAVTNYAVAGGPGGYLTEINNCRLKAATNTISNCSECTGRAGASQLSGGAVSNAGTLTCFGVYDENYTALNGTCQ